MGKRDNVPSVLFYKRLIAATLAGIILLLAALNIVNGVRLHRAHRRVARYESEEARRLVLEEAERLKNTILPEKEKPAGEADATAIMAGSQIVAHALGSVDGEPGLNCLEGFLENYAAGARVFEADLRLTRDGRVVLRHDWRRGWQKDYGEYNIPTFDEFLTSPILEKYTPMSFRGLLLLMEQYPDICVVTDTKFLDPEIVYAQFTAMVNEAHRLGLTYLFDRMAVQVYSVQHFGVVESVYHFPHYVYTLYQDDFIGAEDAFRAKAAFAERNGIEAITMWDSLWHEEWSAIAQEHGVKIYVHTVNDADAAKRILQTGVSGVYSDTLHPEDVEG